MENNDNGLNTDQKNKNITRRNALKIIGYCVVGGAVAGYGINKIVKDLDFYFAKPVLGLFQFLRRKVYFR